MNDKLKQSLDARLGGMHWGGREQAEVLRQIQRKELQDMKYIRRGSGMLAIAIALLFIVMGAAFALTSPTAQPDAPHTADQATEPTFVPVTLAHTENEFFLLTIDSTAYDGATLTFTATLRMKDPEKYMFSLAGHTPPGDPTRLPLRVEASAIVETTAREMLLVSGGDLSAEAEVLAMTRDAATFRMSGTPGSIGPDTRVTLSLAWTAPVTGETRTDALSWTLALSEQPQLTLLENEYITATLTQRRIEGTQSVVTIDVTPAKPWYTLSRAEEDKATLQVHFEQMLIYACNDHGTLLDMVEHRQEPLGALTGSVEETAAGLRWTFRGEMPTGYDSLLGYLCVSITPEAEALHDNSNLPHYAEIIVPLPVAQASASAPTPAPTAAPDNAARRRIFENSLITAEYVGAQVDGYYLNVTIDLFPRNENHLIKASQPGKTTLSVVDQWYVAYDGDTTLAQTGVYTTAPEAIDGGTRLSVWLPFPPDHDEITFFLALTTSSNVASHTNHFSDTVRRPATPTPTPSPLPTSTPRPDPTGQHIGGDDVVSVYLEDVWFDGFTREVTLRIRADDPANTLAVTPNANGTPDGSTWVVQIEDDSSGTVLPPDIQISREEATGDLIVRYNQADLHNVHGNSMSFTLITTNELTWERYATTLRPGLRLSGDWTPQALHLTGSDPSGIFVQASRLTTDRYHYIGLMLNPDAAHIFAANLTLDADAEVLSSTSLNTSGRALEYFPQALFPYDGDDDAKFSLLVLRVDAAVPLPDPLHVTVTRWTGQEYAALAELVLSSTPTQTSSTPTEVSIRMDGNVLFDNEYVTVSFADADYGAGHAFAYIDVALKDIDRFTTSKDILQGCTYLDAQLSFTGYSGALYQNGCEFTSLTDSFDSSNRNFYLHAYADQWTDEQPPTIYARLTLTSADGSVQEEYLAQFTFPVTGTVQLYSIMPTESAECENFEFVSSQMVYTDYLSLLTVGYRCTEPDDERVIRLSEHGKTRQAGLYADGFSDRTETLLRQMICYYTDPPSPTEEADSYALIVYDGHHRLAEFPVTMTRIDK